MAWLRIDADTPGHHKVRRLGRALGVDPLHALGIYVAALAWVMRYKPSGDLTGVDPEDLAAGVGWPGPGDALLAAMATAGLVDVDGSRVTVHDWDEHQGPYLRKLARDRERRAAALAWMRREVFSRVMRSPFLRGEVRDWRATLPWVAKSWRKIVRGDYDARARRGAGASGTEAEYDGPQDW